MVGRYVRSLAGRGTGNIKYSITNKTSLNHIITSIIKYNISRRIIVF